MREIILKIVRETFETFVKSNARFTNNFILPVGMDKPARGVYVSAFEYPGRKPRGRVGSYMPTKSNLIDEIQFQAMELAKTFPFRKQDLPFLKYEIWLTKAPRLVAGPNSVPDESGLLMRSKSGKGGISLPSRRKKTAHARIKEILSIEKNRAEEEAWRYYEIEIEKFHE